MHFRSQIEAIRSQITSMRLENQFSMWFKKNLHEIKTNPPTVSASCAAMLAKQTPNEHTKSVTLNYWYCRSRKTALMPIDRVTHNTQSSIKRQTMLHFPLIKTIAPNTTLISLSVVSVATVESKITESGREKRVIPQIICVFLF